MLRTVNVGKTSLPLTSCLKSERGGCLRRPKIPPRRHDHLETRVHQGGPTPLDEMYRGAERHSSSSAATFTRAYDDCKPRRACPLSNIQDHQVTADA